MIMDLERLKEYHKTIDSVTITFKYKGKKGVVGRQQLQSKDFHGNTLTDVGMQRFLSYIVDMITCIQKKMKVKKNNVKKEDIVVTKYTIHHRHMFN